MVTVVDPEPQQAVHDPPVVRPAFLAAWEHMRKKPVARNPEVYTAERSRFSGVDIVPEVVPLRGKRVSAEPNTENLWIYDLRTNHRFTFEGAADDARRF
jgi:hypothetical protein